MSVSEIPLANPLQQFHPALRRWFDDAFAAPTDAQRLAWPAISDREHTLLLAPTGSGKTLAAFLVAINRLMFPDSETSPTKGVKVLYISPLKALAVDVQRNLRSPLAGVRAVAEREGHAYHLPTIGIRSGDTPAAERQRLQREPPDILITTPESLYLLLTSRARTTLAQIETVIIDEIHSLVRSKRGAHLFLSLERLEDLRRKSQQGSDPLPAAQRIGLSATQRPLAEVAKLLGGGEPLAVANCDPANLPLSDQNVADPPPRPRPVRIVDAGRRKPLELRVEVPVEDMSRLGEPIADAQGAHEPTIPSIWPALHPRLVELIREHRSTMVFVNSRRLAERLATAINETADEELALAHHGSIARDTRLQIEDRLKRGKLAAIVATSSLELGIDMGAVDLVIQIEAPPSIAAGLQRIGRAGHQVGAPSNGVIFPKFRGDLLACSAAVGRMLEGQVEETFYPRNPLDVLAQQLAAMVALEPVPVDELFGTVRRAAPFQELPRSAFEGVLDLLSGRYPSDEFAELRPRVTWDRTAGVVSPRRGTQRIAVLNAGTIPDRGLYGVFLADGEQSTRVGELDEEMVFETHPGDVFLLGASSWRVMDITQDRVLVSPAPGEPGRMPFWRGDGPGRPLEFGRAIGRLVRELVGQSRAAALDQLKSRHALQPRAATNLLDYLADQVQATREVPSDRTVVVECFLDEIGDWRVVIMTPFGSRVHAPWATAVAGRLRAELGGEVDLMWADDGIVFRLPETSEPPPLDLFFPKADEIEDLVVAQLGSTALFAAHFRENAARALLLPRRMPGRRTPLWLQRRRSADLLAVAARYPGFPILLETYRECLRDVFDLPGLTSVLRDVESRQLRVHHVMTSQASPFAGSLLFNYTGNFLYNGDTPLAERRAAALSLDHAQLRELMGDAELRELLDADAIDELGLELQWLGSRRVRHLDQMHELLLRIGDLSREELAARCEPESVGDGAWLGWLEELLAARRVIEVRIAGEARLVAAEDAGRLRDALGVMPPPGLPQAFLESVGEPLLDLVSRYARTHTPFTPEEAARRFGLGTATVQMALDQLFARDRVTEGEFLPGGRGREWVDVEVLRTLKRRSLARLRKEVAPVPPAQLARFLPHWQGLHQPRRGPDGLLDVVAQLQGLPLPASTLQNVILPSRLPDFEPSDLDQLCASGEVVWRGFERLGSNDGRIALYLSDQFLDLAPPPDSWPLEDGVDDGGDRLSGEQVAEPLKEFFQQRGAVFFDDLVGALRLFPNDVLDTLWQLVWSGHVSNDTLLPLRSLYGGARSQSTGGRSLSRFRPRARRLPGSEGRWSWLVPEGTAWPSTTERQTSLAGQMLERYGVVTRNAISSEPIRGGFSGLYPVFKAMEEAGKVRRGYFVEGQGGAQFALHGAEDRLRETAVEGADELLILAATDPANAYGSLLPWPATAETATMRPQRAAGARVILAGGELLGFLNRIGNQLLTFLPEVQPDRNQAAVQLFRGLQQLADGPRPLLLTKIDGEPIVSTRWHAPLLEIGFVASGSGYLLRGSSLGAHR